jgi:hypothetical protein
MLADLNYDLGILVPGEIVGDGKRKLVVVPLGLAHFRSHATATTAIYVAIDKAMESAQSADPGELVQAAAVAVAAVLMGDGFELLNACCAPRLDGPGDDLAAAAAGSWFGQSIDPEMFIPDPNAEAPGDGPPPRPLTFNTVSGRLAAAGHHPHDIFRAVQTGIDGRQLPYCGWTIPQLRYWLSADDTRRARLQADHSQGLAMAISACFGGGDGERSYKEYIEALRAV